MAKACCICGEKMNMWDGTHFSDGDICVICNAKITSLKGSPKVDDVTKAIEYFNSHINTNAISPAVKKDLTIIMDKAEERMAPEIEQLQERKEALEVLAKATERISEEANERKSFLNKYHLVTTGYGFEAYRIKSYYGVVSGEVVLGTGFLSEFSASVADILGTVSSGFSQKMKIAKTAAQAQLIQNAVLAGGNAVIGVDFDYLTFGSNMIGISANGTAVEVVPDDKDYILHKAL